MKDIQKEKKDKVLNIRLGSKDLERLEKLSVKYGGLSYAAVIRMLLHHANKKEV